MYASRDVMLPGLPLPWFRTMCKTRRQNTAPRGKHPAFLKEKKSKRNKATCATQIRSRPQDPAVAGQQKNKQAFQPFSSDLNTETGQNMASHHAHFTTPKGNRVFRSHHADQTQIAVAPPSNQTREKHVETLSTTFPRARARFGRRS